MNSKSYFDLADDFELYFPSLSAVTVEWYPSGRNEITARLENGTKVVYDGINRTIRHLSLNTDEDMSEDCWRTEFGRRLHKKMTQLGLTNEEMSRRTGISAVSISSYINCKSIPSAYKLIQIAKVLGCSVSELTDIE